MSPSAVLNFIEGAIKGIEGLNLVRRAGHVPALRSDMFSSASAALAGCRATLRVRRSSALDPPPTRRFVALLQLAASAIKDSVCSSTVRWDSSSVASSGNRLREWPSHAPAGRRLVPGAPRRPRRTAHYRVLVRERAWLPCERSGGVCGRCRGSSGPRSPVQGNDCRRFWATIQLAVTHLSEFECSSVQIYPQRALVGSASSS